MPTADTILLYQAPDGQTRLEVHLDHETVWLSQAQMAELFDVTRPNVTMHLRNVFKDGELVERAVSKESLLTAADGKAYRVKHYNLDVIISVGYRVKSLRGTHFRQWATGVLRQYLVQGYALNEQRPGESARQLAGAFAREWAPGTSAEATGAHPKTGGATSGPPAFSARAPSGR